MRDTIPAAARRLLDFIGSIEAPEGYETVYGNNQHQLAKPLTQMTLDEVEAAGPGWTRRFGSSACGRYQFMRDTLDSPGTLADIEGEMGLSGSEKMTPELQDLMGFHLLKRRGYEAFVARKIGPVAFGKRLAQEWASFPVLAATKRGKRTIRRGQSYYAGDGRNRALVAPERIEAVLEEVLALAAVAAQPAPAEARPGYPQKGARDNAVVRRVQERLRELGYPEVGTPDGDFGPDTEKAIVSFRLDKGLPLTPTLDRDFMEALDLAAPGERPLGEARTEAPSKEVRQEVPEARANFFTWIAGLIVAFWGLVQTFGGWLVENVGEVKRLAQPLLEAAGDVPWWGYGLVFGGVGLWLFFNGRKGEAAAVAAFREGARR